MTLHFFCYRCDEMSALSLRYQKSHTLAAALTEDAFRMENKLQETLKKLHTAEDQIVGLQQARDEAKDDFDRELTLCLYTLTSKFTKFGR